MNIAEKRIDYLDIAKGILILTVVLCHSDFPYAQYLYWFHMPAFFIISGLLHKDSLNIHKQVIKFFVPYLTFSVIDIILGFIATPSDISVANAFDYFVRHIYSGKNIPGVFWFIPVLFMTKVIFYYLNKELKTPYLIGLLVLLYAAGHYYSMYVIPDDVFDLNNTKILPWNIDVLLITLPYYSIGYFSKKIIGLIENKAVLLGSFLGSLSLFFINLRFQIYYYLNIKYSDFKEPLWDLVFPLLITVFILSLSSYLNKTVKYIKTREFFKVCGANSLIIMYLHIPLNHAIEQFIKIDYIEFLTIGMVVPLCFAVYFINKYNWSQFLFLGKDTSFKFNLKNASIKLSPHISK